MSLGLTLALATFIWSGLQADPPVRRIPVAPAETVAVTITGTGDPVVVIPGLLGSAFGFRKVVAALENEGLMVLVVDPLGTGSSSAPSGADYSLAAQTSRVAAVCDSLGVRSAIVVAHTLGAGIAFRLAAHRGDLVGGIVSINGGPAETAGSPGLRFALRFAPLAKLIGGKGMMRRKIRDGLRKGAADPSWVTEEVVDSYAAHYKENAGRALRTMKAIASAREPYALEPLLQNIEAPVVVMVGTGSAEAATVPEEMATLATEVPRVRVDTISSAGHYIQEEQPELVAATILELREALANVSPQPNGERSPTMPAVHSRVLRKQNER
jgi:pimeloyl-ACP methyl ester carboxylesterase